MKIALVHELLTMRGGAERVLKIFSEMFPEAPIYTLLYDEKKLGDWFPKKRILTSSLQRQAERLHHFPFSIFNFSFNHHLYLSQFPAAVEEWDFSGFDVVLSSSSAFAHGIITNGAPRHVCYVQSPARYLWDRTHDVLERSDRGLLGPLKKRYLSQLFHRLRIWDSEAADRPDHLIAASAEVQRRIELYWRRKSEVIHPPVDDFWLETSSHPSAPRSSGNEGRYYLIVSQLVPYKRIDIAIRACTESGSRLLIAGEGPARKSLEAIAGPTVAFLGFQTDEALRNLYRNADATIFPGEEDFGLVPLESLACGTPVIAYRGGGALETLDGSCAEFFEEAASDSLRDAMTRMRARPRRREDCRARAALFSRARFEKAIREKITTAHKSDSGVAVATPGSNL